MSIYVRQVNRYPLLKKEEEIELGALALTKNKEAINKLIVSNLRFVIKIANKYKNYCKRGNITLSDLVQEGNDGLIYAANKYDIRKGYKFTTYAVWWITARIMHAIIKSYSMIKIGKTAAEKQLFFKIEYVEHLLEIPDITERTEARKQLSEMTGLPISKIEKMEQRVSWNDVSFDAKQSNSEEQQYTLHDMIADSKYPENSIIETDIHNKTKSIINEAMKNLTFREKDIINRRWLCSSKQTLCNVGKEHGISRERVRQIETNVLTKMRKYIQNNKICKKTINEILK